MSWLIVPALKDGNSLALVSSDALLRILATLKEQYVEIKNRSALELLDLLLSNPDQYRNSIGVAASLIGGVSVDEIMAYWAELKAKYESDMVQRLILLSRTFDQLRTDTTGLVKYVDWKPLNRDVDRILTPNPSVTLSVQASASLSFEFEALPEPPALPSDVKASLGTEALVRMAFKGGLSIGGKAAMAGGPLLVNLTGSVTREVDADLYFLENGDTVFGVALADNLQALLVKDTASPFQVDGLARLIDQEALYCLKLRAEGNLVFGASLAMGQTFSLGNQVSASIGATIGYRLTKTGTFEYLLAGHEVEGEKAIAIHIRRSRAKESAISESLGLEMDPRALAKELTANIEKYFGKAESAVKEFGELLPGSDLVNSELSKLIDDIFQNAESVKPMIRSLVGLDPNQTPEEVLRDLVIGKIETAAETWSDDIESATAAIAQQIIDKLPPYAINLPALRDTVMAAVNKALVRKRELLLNAVEGKISSSTEFKRIAKQLNQAGAVVSVVFNDIQDAIDRVSGALRQLFDRVQARIAEMRGYLEAITTKTVSLRIASQTTQKQQDGLDLRFDLFPGRKGAQEVLSAILVGDMNQVTTIINGQGAQPAAVARAGSYTIYQSTNVAVASDFVLWNFQLGSKSILDADVKWVVGLDSTITAMSTASYKVQNASLKEKSTVGLVENCDLFFVDKRRTLSLGLTISNEDEEMSLDEVKAFFAGVVARHLLSQSVVDKAIERFRQEGKNKTRKGRLDIGLTLNGDQLSRLLSVVEPMRTATQSAENDAECRLPRVKCVGEYPKQGCSWVLNTLAEIQAEVLTNYHADKVLIDRLNKLIKVVEIPGGLVGAIKQMTPERLQNLYGAYHIYQSHLPYSDEFGYLNDLSMLEYRRHAAMAMYEILAHMKALVDTSVGATRGAVTKVGDWTPEKLQAQQYRIAQLVPIWWLWSHEWKNWAFLTNDMRATTIAFLESWVTLARGPDGEGEAPVVWASISLARENGNLVPVLLT